MPSFLARRPFMSALDLDADAGRKTEALECVDDARVEVEDVDDALMGAHLELSAVARQERRVAPALFLAQDVNLGLELGVGLDGAGLCKHLAADDVFALDAAEQHTDVVAGLALL